MEERDDLEQMAFIQKWNDGKAEREKKREQMWKGILEKAGIKKEEKKNRNDFLEKMKRTQMGTQNFSSYLSFLKFYLSSLKKIKKYAII